MFWYIDAPRCPVTNESRESIAVSAGRISAATLVSRVFGLVRDSFFAAIFGTTLFADAFNMAFVIPNFLRRVFGEGALNASYVPVYTHYLKTEGEKPAEELAVKVFSVLILVVGVIVVLGALLASPIVHVYAFGWRESPETMTLTIKLTRLLFPYLLFVSLSALAGGTLNSRGYFALPAFAPAFLNVALIAAGAIILLSPSGASERSIVIFSIGALVGGVLQIVSQIPLLRKTGHKLKFEPDFRDPGVRWIGRLMVPGMLAFAVTQVNTLVDLLLATILPEGSVTALRLGNRVAVQPLGIFGIAITTAVLPTLSSHAARDDTGKLVEDFAFSMKLMLALLIPSTVVLLVLAKPIVRLLFERGEFTAASSTPKTVNALVFYSIGLFGYGGVKAVVQAFYSMKDTVTPMRIAIVSVILNVALDLALVRRIGLIGLAVATSATAITGFALLCWVLSRRMGGIKGREIWASVAKMLVASAPMAVGMFLVARALDPWAVNVWGKLLQVGAASLAGLLLLVTASLALRAEEIIFIMRTLLRARLKR
jgi:putative peptidoglycan lipid II flippase